MKIGPQGYFTPERLASRKKEQLPPVLFHWTGSLNTALKILSDGALKGNPGISTSENPAFGTPGPVVFVLSPSAILAKGLTLWPYIYGRGYEGEAEWYVAHALAMQERNGIILTPPIRLPLRGVVRMIGYKSFWKREEYRWKVRALRLAAQQAGINVRLFEWWKWWKDGLAIPKNPH